MTDQPNQQPPPRREVYLNGRRVWGEANHGIVTEAGVEVGSAIRLIDHPQKKDVLLVEVELINSTGSSKMFTVIQLNQAQALELGMGCQLWLEKKKAEGGNPSGHIPT